MTARRGCEQRRRQRGRALIDEITDAGVAAAVVVSGDRVLFIRREVSEGTLSWQFPAGKVLPGETAEAAAVREAAEEAGVIVIARQVLGERIHPGTGAAIVYIACDPVSGIAWPASPREVAEVRWVSAQEADELAAGTIHEPVRQYLHEISFERPREADGDVL